MPTQADINTIIFEALVETGEEVRSYCGRGMRDDCLGVVCDHPIDVVIAAIANIPDEDAPYALHKLQNSRTDSMGLQSIVYWPHIPWNADWTV